MTEQEKNLWYKFLRSYPVKFYRQKTLGNYIVDFYCHKAKLVVELDGAHHFEKDNREHDEIRTKYLNSLGIEVVRFSNRECDDHFEGVCLEIDKLVKINIDK